MLWLHGCTSFFEPLELLGLFPVELQAHRSFILYTAKFDYSTLRMSFAKNRIYPPTPHQWADMPASFSREELIIGGWQVMQSWELPLMRVMAEAVTQDEGDVLEIGFGMGICANEIAAQGCRSYAVIEAHPDVVKVAREWGEEQSFPVTVHEGLWQDVVPTLDRRYDGIVFDTFPLAPEERSRNHFPFIPLAPALLKAGGVLTLYSDESTDFRAEHLSLLLSSFADVRLIKVENLKPPEDCEYWKQPVMVIPVARTTADGMGPQADGIARSFEPASGTRDPSHDGSST